MAEAELIPPPPLTTLTEVIGKAKNDVVFGNELANDVFAFAVEPTLMKVYAALPIGTLTA
jgi:hypothetical protein